ncbi:MAG: histidine--tRNA ligase [Fimbriimonadia bacterium]|jgi:histidyl-tRNA synthetase
MDISAPRGTKDALPDEARRWRFVEDTFRRLCRLYGYGEIRTPVFEHTELFVRGVGEGTDIVSKEMYTFLDKGGRSITLKPEGTAPAVRAYVEHHLGGQGAVTKLFYVTPIFRYERPQAGRLRQAHQVGLEVFGAASPAADAEVIQLTMAFYEALGLKDLELRLNSLGDAECRRRYREALLSYAAPYVASLPEDVAERMRNNPLRLLDSKDPDCIEAMNGAPSIQDYLEPESREHFEALLALLRDLGVACVLEPRLVRGLDYYNRTVFEVVSGSLGAQNSVCGGGRYDGLVELCGGPSTPAVGVAMGIERALMLLDETAPIAQDAPVAFVVAIGAEMGPRALKLATELRQAGIATDLDLETRSAKSQFRQADRSGARFAVVLGEDEWSRDAVVVKDLRAQSQTEVPVCDLVAALSR